MCAPLCASGSSSSLVDSDPDLASLSLKLIDKLGNHIHRLTAYDLKSALTGLVTGRVDKVTLSVRGVALTSGQGCRADPQRALGNIPSEKRIHSISESFFTSDGSAEYSMWPTSDK